MNIILSSLYCGFLSKEALDEEKKSFIIEFQAENCSFVGFLIPSQTEKSTLENI